MKNANYMYKNIYAKNFGITLIALVVTIIVLLILSGVSITMIFGSNGIINKAIISKQEAKRASIIEALELAVIDVSSQNMKKDEKEILTLTREKVETKNILKDLGKDISTTEIKEKGTEVYFYVIVDKEVYRVTMNGTTYESMQSEEEIELQEGDIEFDITPSEWSNGTVKVGIKVNTNKITEYAIKYKIEGQTNWSTYTKEIEVSDNCDIYAKLEGINGTTSEATATIDKIDRTNPNAPTLQVASGTLGNNEYYTSDVEVKITEGTDNESGAGKTTYILSGATTSEETIITSGNTIKITAEGSTTVTAYTYDKANNKSIAKELTIKKDSTAPTINYESDVKVNINTVIDETYIRNNTTIQDNLTSVSIADIKVKTSANTENSSNLNGYDVYALTYKIKDEAGNSKDVSQSITTKPLTSKTLTNKLNNPGFESELSNYYNGIPYRSSTIKRTGNYSMYYTCNSQQYFLRIRYGDIGMQNNQIYARWYARTDDTSLTPGMYVIRNPSNTDYDTNQEYSTKWMNSNETYNNWQRGSVLTPTGTKNYQYLVMQLAQSNGTASGNVYWDDLMALVLDNNTWETIPTCAWLDKMVPDFTGTQTFSW